MTGRFERLKKYHSRPKTFMIKNNDGEEEEWNIYPLPAKYMDLTVELQSIINDAPNKLDLDGNEIVDDKGNPIKDPSKLPADLKKRMRELNIEILITSIAFSECINSGELNYDNFSKGVPDNIINEAREAVELMSQDYIAEIMVAVSSANNMDLTGGKKKVEVSH